MFTISKYTYKLDAAAAAALSAAALASAFDIPGSALERKITKLHILLLEKGLESSLTCICLI